MVALKKIIVTTLAALILCGGASVAVYADEYEEYGYQFSPGYYDAMQQDPTFGGRQGEVEEVAEPPAPTASEEGSPRYNYDTGEDTYQYTYYQYPC